LSGQVLPLLDAALLDLLHLAPVPLLEFGPDSFQSLDVGFAADPADFG
jgi:hypothetical protein